MSGHEHHGHHGHRESFAIPGGEAFLVAGAHDQAATVSMTLCPDAGERIPFGKIVEKMEAVARIAEDAGGIVGHIKGFAREDEAYAHASVTEAGRAAECEGDLSASFGENADIQLVFIVLLIGCDDLAAICKEAFGAL